MLTKHLLSLTLADAKQKISSLAEAARYEMTISL
jgi:hypothetical protein